MCKIVPIFSYSFEPNPDWSQSYSPQPEIQEYLEKVAHKYDIGKHVEFGKKVMKTTWDETTKKWTVELDNGEVQALSFFNSSIPKTGQESILLM